MAQEIAKLRNDLDKARPRLVPSLPRGMSIERFERVVMTAAQREPSLMRADRGKLFLELTRCAADGLVPDGREAAIVMFKNDPVYMPMVQGIIGRLKATKAVDQIKAVLVSREEIDAGAFRVREGTNPGIEHEPLLVGQKGEPVVAYAVAWQGESHEFEVMLQDEWEAVEQSSRAKNGPWKGAFRGEMIKKTVIRRLAKRLVLPDAVRQIVEADDRMYEIDKKNDEPSAAQGGALAGLAAAALPSPRKTDEAHTAQTSGDSEGPQDLVAQINGAESAESAASIFDMAVNSGLYDEVVLERAQDALDENWATAD